MPLATPTTPAEFPDKLKMLFEPHRYKVLWGGRGAGRSWGAARALLILGTSRAIRVLCAREFQNSISESVHKVLSDQIEGLGLSGFYDIQKQGIYGKNGTSFSFEGIKNNTTRIKSYEGVDYCWVEEAVKVSKASWDVLIPTIRKTGSEIWMTFNPELESDYTYQRFVKGAGPNVAVTHMTWRDNPWFPPELLLELESSKEYDYDTYLNVWEGKCRQHLEGVVYAKELRRAEEHSRVTSVPVDRGTPVSAAFDLGRADKTAIWFFQRVAMQTRVIGYYENNLEDTLHYARYLQSRPWAYDTFWLPHDAFAKRLGMKLTIEEQFREHFPSVRMGKVPNLSIADGINMARLTFDSLWIDAEGCADGLSALRHYKYKIIGYKEDGKTPIFSDKPQHDDPHDSSHGADAFRYMAIGLSRPSGRSDKSGLLGKLLARPRVQSEFSGRGSASGDLGWMK